jgi:hypothetical protein
MHLCATKGFAILVFVVLATIGAISAIDVDAPPELLGELRTTGQIVECEFRSVGLRGGQEFIGVKLNDPALPLLRISAPVGNRSRYEALCTRKANVNVLYRSVRRAFGPLRFWVHEIAEA